MDDGSITLCITYFYNVYGEREISEGKYATLIALFKKKYLCKEKLTVVSPVYKGEIPYTYR